MFLVLLKAFLSFIAELQKEKKTKSSTISSVYYRDTVSKRALKKQGFLSDFLIGGINYSLPLGV